MVDTRHTWPNAEYQSAHSIQECPATLRALPLWPFALAVYQAPQAAALCLRLQNEGNVDVCLLLWRLWLYAARCQPTAAAAPLMAAHQDWQSRHTVPLRQLRQRVKPWVSQGAQHWYDQLLRTELVAERYGLAALEQGSLKDAIVEAASRQRAQASIVAAYPLPTGECGNAVMQLIDIADDMRAASLS